MGPLYLDPTVICFNSFYFIEVIYSRLSRCCTTRGPVSRYYLVVPPWWGLVSSVIFAIKALSSRSVG